MCSYPKNSRHSDYLYPVSLGACEVRFLNWVLNSITLWNLCSTWRPRWCMPSWSPRDSWPSVGPTTVPVGGSFQTLFRDSFVLFAKARRWRRTIGILSIIGNCHMETLTNFVSGSRTALWAAGTRSIWMWMSLVALILFISPHLQRQFTTKYMSRILIVRHNFLKKYWHRCVISSCRNGMLILVRIGRINHGNGVLALSIFEACGILRLHFDGQQRHLHDWCS